MNIFGVCSGLHIGIVLRKITLNGSRCAMMQACASYTPWVWAQEFTHICNLNKYGHISSPSALFEQACLSFCILTEPWCPISSIWASLYFCILTKPSGPLRFHMTSLPFCILTEPWCLIGSIWQACLSLFSLNHCVATLSFQNHSSKAVCGRCVTEQLCMCLEHFPLFSCMLPPQHSYYLQL